MRISVFIVLALASDVASAYCPTSPPKNWRSFGFTRVPVQLDPALPPMLKKPDGTAWTVPEMRAEIEWAIEAANSYSSANVPALYYDGESIAGPHNIVAGKILITYMTSCSLRGAVLGDPVPGMTLELARSGFAPCPLTWDHWQSPVTGLNNVLSGLLLHEFGHTIGLNHSDGCGGYSCSSTFCSVMYSAAGSEETTTWYADDVDALQSAYGQYPNTGSNRNHQESSDALTWYGMTTPPQSKLQPLFSMASTTLALLRPELC